MHTLPRCLWCHWSPKHECEASSRTSCMNFLCRSKAHSQTTPKKSNIFQHVMQEWPCPTENPSYKPSLFGFNQFSAVRPPEFPLQHQDPKCHIKSENSCETHVTWGVEEGSSSVPRHRIQTCVTSTRTLASVRCLCDYLESNVFPLFWTGIKC
jgi:hypothetical protein